MGQTRGLPSLCWSKPEPVVAEPCLLSTLFWVQNMDPYDDDENGGSSLRSRVCSSLFDLYMDQTSSFGLRRKYLQAPPIMHSLFCL